MFAARLHALGRGFEYLNGFGAGEGFFLFSNLHQHGFAANDERDEDHKPINTPDAFAAEGHVVNRQFNAITDIEGWRRVGLGKASSIRSKTLSQFELNGGSLSAPS